MPDGVTFKLEGIEALTEKLKTLSEDIKYKGGRTALRKAAQLVAKAAAANAMKIDDPDSAENISRNIVDGNKYPGVRWSSRRFKSTGDLMFRVGVSGGAGGSRSSEQVASANPGGDTRHWRLVEFGSEHNTPARPFMRPALSENIQPATSEFIKEYDKAIDRALRRAKKK